MKSNFVFWTRVAAIFAVLVLFIDGKPPATAQRNYDYRVPDVTHDGLVGTLTHQNDAVNTLAVTVDKLAESQTRTFQRMSAVEAQQAALVAELRIWGSLLSLLIGSGVIMQVKKGDGSSAARKAALKLASKLGSE